MKKTKPDDLHLKAQRIKAAVLNLNNVMRECADTNLIIAMTPHPVASDKGNYLQVSVIIHNVLTRVDFPKMPDNDDRRKAKPFEIVK